MSNSIVTLAYDNQPWILIDCQSLKPVQALIEVADFRGDQFILMGGRAPHKPGSTGKVFVKFQGSDGMVRGGLEFYPSVFDLQWVPVVSIAEA